MSDDNSAKKLEDDELTATPPAGFNTDFLKKPAAAAGIADNIAAAVTGVPASKPAPKTPAPGTAASKTVEEMRVSEPKGAPIQAKTKLATLPQLLEFLRTNNGSDIHVSSGNWVMMRIRGTMHQVTAKVEDKDVRNLIMPYMTDKQKEELEREKMLDFAFTNPGVGVFRANVFYQRFGLAFVLRLLPEKPPTLEELDVPSIIRRSCYTDNGLILVTGPTGSGKSTTLAAMINEINTHRRGHIITIEDPVEYLHTSKKCMVNQRSLGIHFNDFAGALKACLREDPDVILVGEMRDRETMQAAIRAAETGHLVLATLHTGSAAKSVDRMLNMFPADEQDEVRTVLSETLRVVISQKLIPNKAGTKLKLFQDILVNTRAVANLIREGKTYLIENAMQTASDEGMLLMDKAIRVAAEEGMIPMADAHEAANDKRIIEESKSFARNESGIIETVSKMARDEFGKAVGETGKVKKDTGIINDPNIKVTGEVPPDKVGPIPAQAKEIIGLKDIVAELKPGFKKRDGTAPPDVDPNAVPVHITRKLGKK